MLVKNKKIIVFISFCLITVLAYFIFEEIAIFLRYLNTPKYSSNVLLTEQKQINDYLSKKYSEHKFNVKVTQSYDKHTYTTGFFSTERHHTWNWTMHYSVRDENELSFNVYKDDTGIYTDDYAKIYNLYFYGKQVKHILEKYRTLQIDSAKILAFVGFLESGVIYDSGVFENADCLNMRLCSSTEDMLQLYVSESDAYVSFYFNSLKSQDIADIRHDIDYLKSISSPFEKIKISFPSKWSDPQKHYYICDILSDFSDEEIKSVIQYSQTLQDQKSTTL